jgi:hypothetical protein
MADDKVEYVITIRTEGGEGGSGSNGGVSKTKDGEDVSGLLPEGVKNAFAFGVAAVGKVANTVATLYLNRVDITTGNTALAQKLTFQYAEMTRALAISAAIVGGALTGNVPAVIGGVAAVVSRGASVIFDHQNISLSKNLEDITIREASIRAGASGDRYGRNGN